MDTVSAPAAAPAPSAPAVIKTGMDAHGMKFVPREVIQDYRDRLYHGKPEFNYKGIPYRQPKRVEKANVGDRLAVCGRQPVPDYLLKELAEEYFRLEGRLPTACTYPGVGCRRYRGLTIPGAGPVLLELLPMQGDFEPFVHQLDGSDRLNLDEAI